MQVFDALAPIVALIALGAVLRRAGFLKPTFFHEINPVIYWVALPCMLFQKTASTKPVIGEAMKVTLLLLGGIAASLVIGALVGFLLRMKRQAMGAFVQGAFRGNYVYVGIPVIIYALAGSGSMNAEGLEALVFLAIAPLVPVNNILAVIVLLAGRGSPPAGAGKLRRTIIDLFLNPIIISLAAGVTWSAAKFPLPGALDQALGLMGQTALPLALFSTGSALSFGDARGRLMPATAAALVKIAAAPAVGYALALAAGFTGTGMKVGVILLGCPSAVISFVMAEQLDADHRLAGSIVLVSTVMSIVSFAVILALM